MTTIIIRSGLLFVVVVASLLLFGVELAVAERASDARELISLETPEGWIAVLREQMQEKIRKLQQETFEKSLDLLTAGQRKDLEEKSNRR